MSKLDTNSHSVFLLSYHLILVVKYRRKVINDTIANRIKEIGEYIAPKYNISFLEYNHDKDHAQQYCNKDHNCLHAGQFKQQK